MYGTKEEKKRVRAIFNAILTCGDKTAVTSDQCVACWADRQPDPMGPTLCGMVQRIMDFASDPKGVPEDATHIRIGKRSIKVNEAK
jgi:hypothetical protein